MLVYFMIQAPSDGILSELSISFLPNCYSLIPVLPAVRNVPRPVAEVPGAGGFLQRRSPDSSVRPDRWKVGTQLFYL